jgi:hypothetical protein
MLKLNATSPRRFRPLILEMPSLREDTYLKVFLKHDEMKGWLFWWGTSQNNIKYPIAEKNIQAALDPSPESLDLKLAKYRTKLNEIYAGAIGEFEGSYSSSLRKLTLKA